MVIDVVLDRKDYNLILATVIEKKLKPFDDRTNLQIELVSSMDRILIVKKM